jgi:hypothetical protein
LTDAVEKAGSILPERNNRIIVRQHRHVSEARVSRHCASYVWYFSWRLIGRSELESGDPPMGVAFGQFEPTDTFAPLRTAMKPARDGAGKEQRDT